MGRKTILCVDDEVSILRSLERCLSFADFDVIKASSGEEALNLLTQHASRIDLVIVDQRMPGMSGDELLKQVREKFGHLPAIMLSGYADFDSLVRAVSDGEIAYFIAKPWNNKELVDMVQSLLRSPRPTLS